MVSQTYERFWRGCWGVDQIWRGLILWSRIPPTIPSDPAEADLVEGNVVDEEGPEDTEAEVDNDDVEKNNAGDDRPPSLPKIDGCISVRTYDKIHDDVADDRTRSHFLGGVVRLAAHDFMDYDRRATVGARFGSDGCVDFSHGINAGLPEDIWCDAGEGDDRCPLAAAYRDRYAPLGISRADFWIAAAEAVVRHTSVDVGGSGPGPDLRRTFEWGRIDAVSCAGSADRLPSAGGCRDVAETFLVRMGLEWRDAAALMGAHTLGGGSARFSGHEGVWAKNNQEAQVFDKSYYEDLVRNPWRPRNLGLPFQDWTMGNPLDAGDAPPRMMLNTDLCLAFDLDRRFPCCTRTDSVRADGSNRCEDDNLSNSQCHRYRTDDPRAAAASAVGEYLGGSSPNTNNGPFYEAFAVAWGKATTNGWSGLLRPPAETC